MGGATGYPQETFELTWVVATESFRDVVARRSGGISDLLAELEVLGRGWFRREIKDAQFEFPRELRGNSRTESCDESVFVQRTL